MFSKLKKWWRGQGQSTLPVRIPMGGVPAVSDDSSPPVFAPTRFSSSAVQEKFAAAVLNTQPTLIVCTGEQPTRCWTTSAFTLQ